MAAPQTIAALSSAGTSVWLDDLSRDRIKTGNLAEVIETKGVVGVTTNPAIFATAMTSGNAYDAQLKELSEAGVGADSAVFDMAIDDVRDACDIFAPVFRDTDGVDGRVSLEVDPRLAKDREATVAQAKELAHKVDRPNLMIKIPATEECLPAITDVLAEGISVNVTLIFSVARYRQVMQAFIEGIAAARDNGHDISTIHSVASFFVSRVDTEIDKRLDAIGTDEALALKGTAAVANARLAYAAFEDALLNNPDWEELRAAGGRTQRPLWASTSVKDPSLPDTLYVTELSGPHTVNTMPEATLDATIDHGEVTSDTLSGTGEASHEVFSKLSDLGIDLADVWTVLETEGVDKFVASWQDLLAALDEQLR
ncbi:transaldolase [Corynebacterium sp. zg254]|uniref:Transaldolase n=1 Tax=Corynebacterium zhongnanshanii TaxID=2768834 RepID=A0ABQ6VGN2_9CORY|nr:MULTISPECIES: transaldolase [Corynebacterium]KAB3523478.1 transaldolase [Corynebacterium zhongnanshanii]MCR5913380.1 transaldolase [Corynebacterium sp. zg254]